MYTLVGRFLLAFLFAPDSPGSSLARLPPDHGLGHRDDRFGDAALHPDHLFLPAIGAFWLFVLRHVYYVALANAGATPTLGLP